MMKIKNLGGARSVNEYVAGKLARFSSMEKDFGSLFELMFSEGENILIERMRGLKVEKTTYNEAKNDILRISSVLRRKLGMIPSDAPVGIHMENSLLWIEMFWAVILCGRRPLLMNLTVPGETLSSACEMCGVKAVVADSAGADGTVCGIKAFEAREIFEEASSLSELPSPDLRECGGEILLMTSGTTSGVKICAYGADQLYCQIKYSFEIIKKNRLLARHYRGELKHLTFLPFYHIFGLVAVYIWFAFYSRTFVLLNDLASDTVTQTVRRRHVTHIFAVPLFWEKVYGAAMKKIRARGPATVAKFEKGMKIAEKIYSLPAVGNVLGNAFSRAAFREIRRGMFGESISFMISGGGPVPREVLRFFNLIGYRLVNGYGMTETGITSVELRNRVGDIIKGAVGRPLGGVEFSLDGNGMLSVKGKVNAKYIIENGRKHETAGFFATCDLASEEDGYYTILGRSDDLIVLSDGENINPDEAEKVFKDAGAESVCLVKKGAGAVLVAEVKRFAPPGEAAALKERLAKAAGASNLRGRLSDIVITDVKLIADGDFKVSRTKIRRLLEEGAITDISGKYSGKYSGKSVAGGPEGTDGDAGGNGEAEAVNGSLIVKVIELMCAATGAEPSEVRPDSDFFRDLGGTSLDYFQLVSDLEREFGAGFPAGRDGEGITTAEGFARYLKEAGV